MANRSQVGKYLQALERLKAQDKPINNDAVAAEAGSGKGSIKRSRPGHADLIVAIDQAAQEQKQAKAAADPLPALKSEIALLSRRLDEALDREMSLLAEVYELREKVRQLSKGRLTVTTSKSR